MRKVTLALALTAGCALANAQGSNWRLFAGLGLVNGGETISAGNITNTTTGNQTPYDVKTASGPQFRLGADYRIASRLSLQGSIGYSANDPMGYNGSLTFTTIPVELLGFVSLTDALRIGGGVRKTSAEMTGTGISSNWPEVGIYSSTTGAVVEAQYLFPISAGQPGYQSSQFGFSVRYVSESFSHNAISYKGDHVEVGMALYY
jgi:hypothetical protein